MFQNPVADMIEMVDNSIMRAPVFLMIVWQTAYGIS